MTRKRRGVPSWSSGRHSPPVDLQKRAGLLPHDNRPSSLSTPALASLRGTRYSFWLRIVTMYFPLSNASYSYVSSHRLLSSSLKIRRASLEMSSSRVHWYLRSRALHIMHMSPSHLTELDPRTCMHSRRGTPRGGEGPRPRSTVHVKKYSILKPVQYCGTAVTFHL